MGHSRTGALQVVVPDLSYQAFAATLLGILLSKQEFIMLLVI